jgi:Protein of unknown function (DUF1036)
MKHIPIALLLTAFLVAAQPVARAQGAPRRINAKICNDGDLAFHVAVARRNQGWSWSDTWLVSGWYKVSPRECLSVGQGDTTMEQIRRDKAVLYVAFAYPSGDEPHFDGGHPDGWRSDERKLCVRLDRHFDYEANDDDDGPDGECKEGYTAILTRYAASGLRQTIYNPTGPNGVDAGDPPDMHITLK